MAKVEKTEVFDHPIEDVYAVIIDYPQYPSFVDGVSDIEVLESSNTQARVKYHLNLIKKFSYIITISQNAPQGISWQLESGDLFKSNKGGWKLKKLSDQQTEVTYWLDVTFKMLVPRPIVNNLVKNSLPSMLESFNKRISEVRS